MRMDCNQFADNAEGWQNHDVNSRVAVEPKEVLERDWVTIKLWIKNPDVHGSLGDQQQQRNSQHWCRQHLNDAG